MHVIDYDQIDVWGPWFDTFVAEIAGRHLLKDVREARYRWVEDARDHVVKQIGLETLINHLNECLASYHVRVFHGTRVTKAEASKIEAVGLKGLIVPDRRDALIQIFRQHTAWSEEKEQKLDELLHQFGPGWEAARKGRREDDSVHVLLSRAGLLSKGCNHYLKYGAEVDKHIAQDLFSDDSARRHALCLLNRNRAAKLVSFTAPFPYAATAANPIGFPRAELPSLLERLI